MENNNYINDVDFTNQILNSKIDGKIRESAVAMYKLIVENMIKSKKYNGYPEDIKADMQNTAYYFFLKYWANFDKPTGAYSYYTRMCQNAYHQEITKYYKYNKNFDTIYNSIKDNFKNSTEDAIDEDYL